MIIEIIQKLTGKELNKAGNILGLELKKIFKKSLRVKLILEKFKKISEVDNIKHLDNITFEKQFFKHWGKKLKVDIRDDDSNKQAFLKLVDKVEKFKDFEKLERQKGIKNLIKTSSKMVLPLNPAAGLMIHKLNKDEDKRKILELLIFINKVNQKIKSGDQSRLSELPEKIELDNKKIGLVLSGGGARGAYEIGVLKRLQDLNLNYQVVAGTSVGALNGAIVVQDQLENAFEIWDNLVFDKVFYIDKRKVIGVLFDALEILLLGKASAAMKILLSGRKGFELLNLGFLNPEPLQNILDKNVNYQRILESKTKFIICTTNLHYKNIKEFHIAEELGINKLPRILWASISIPFLFPSGKLKGDIKMDGGLPVVGENVPINAVIHEDLDVIIVIYTKREDIPVIQHKQGKLIINIYPDEKYHFNKALKFDTDFIHQLINDGKKDAENFINEYLK